MGLLGVANHLLNLAAPALFLALLLPLLAGWILPRTTVRWSRTAQAGMLFVAGLGVLVAGLWWWGQDGKMATYSAMVLVCASLQWWLRGGWKKS